MLAIKKFNLIILPLCLFISNTIMAKDTETIKFSIVGSVVSKPQCQIVIAKQLK